MTQQTLVFNTELVGYDGVHRTIAIRDDLTLVDLHYALQSAFDWDDDHLYAFWLHGSFWASDCDHYLHPRHAAGGDPRCKSASTPLVELDLSEGCTIAYVFDFASEWRVRLTLDRAAPAGGGVSSRVLKSVGKAPPQYMLPVVADARDTAA